MLIHCYLSSFYYSFAQSWTPFSEVRHDPWNLFNQFLSSVFQSVDFALPISPTILGLFVAFLYDRKYAPWTVITYVSAISYSHKLYGFPDPSKAFLLVQMLKGYGKVGFQLDSRLPLTLPILHRLMQAAPVVTNSSENAALFMAMCSLAFYDCCVK